MPVQHRQTTRYVETAHGNLDPGLAERSSDVQRPRVLVRLDADESDQPEIVVAPKTGEERGYVDVGVRLVDHRDVDGDVRPENLPLGAIRGNAVYGGERIRGDHCAPPADHISVVIVM